jgi:hypothetical protein
MAAAAGAAVGGALVSGFTDSVSALGDSVSRLATGSSLGVAATVLSTIAMGVCAPAIAAVNKQKVITVNEVTMCTGDLEPSILTLLIHVCR